MKNLSKNKNLKIIKIIFIFFVLLNSQQAFSKTNCENAVPTFENINYIIVDLSNMPNHFKNLKPELNKKDLEPIFKKVVLENLAGCIKDFNKEKSVYFALKADSTDAANPNVLNIKFNIKVIMKKENIPEHVILTSGFYRKIEGSEEIYKNANSFNTKVYFPGIESQSLNETIESFLLESLRPRNKINTSQIDSISGPIIRKYP